MLYHRRLIELHVILARVHRCGWAVDPPGYVPREPLLSGHEHLEVKGGGRQYSWLPCIHLVLNKNKPFWR